MASLLIGEEIINHFAENLRARGKQPATLESYCRDAQRFLDYLQKHSLPILQVEPGTLVAYQSYLRDECEEKHNSVRRTVIGIRQFFRFLTEMRNIPGSPFDLVPIPARDESLPQGLDEEDVEDLISVASAGYPELKAARDTAIILMLAFEGLKANELIQLTWSHFLDDEQQGSLAIPGTKARSIRPMPRTSAWLRQYRKLYDTIKHPAIEHAPEKRVFVAFKGREAASPLPVMTRHGLKFILYELGEKTGLPHLNTEQLRHFAVQNLLASGRTTEEIMLHLGLRRPGNIAKHINGHKNTKPLGPSSADHALRKDNDEA